MLFALITVILIYTFKFFFLLKFLKTVFESNIIWDLNVLLFFFSIQIWQFYSSLFDIIKHWQVKQFFILKNYSYVKIKSSGYSFYTWNFAIFRIMSLFADLTYAVCVSNKLNIKVDFLISFKSIEQVDQSCRSYTWRHFRKLHKVIFSLKFLFIWRIKNERNQIFESS